MNIFKQEKPLIEVEELSDVTPVRSIIQDEESEDNMIEERCIEEENIKEERDEESEIVEEKINSIFNNNTSDSEVYVTYNIFILRDGDTLDTIMEKYGVTEEELKKYNDLSNLQLGDKLIIPNSND